MFGACSSGDYEFTKVAPVIVSPLSTSNVEDVSGVFRDTFCTLLTAQSDDTHECSDYFYDFGAPEAITFERRDLKPLATPMHILIIPGIFGECITNEVSPFEYASRYVSDRYPNIRISLANEVNGRASSQFNSNQIRKEIQSLDVRPDERLVLISYSKGAADTLHYLANHYGTETKKISAIVSLAGVVIGTPIADRAGETVARIGGNLPLEECPTQDASGIESLTLKSQFKWLSDNPQIFDHQISFFSLVTASDTDRTSAIFRPFHAYIQEAAGINDGQVPASHQIIPGSRLLGHIRSDHWAAILPFSRKDALDLGGTNRLVKLLATKNEFPREVLLESILRTVDQELR
jgi:hypothetical protein